MKMQIYNDSDRSNDSDRAIYSDDYRASYIDNSSNKANCRETDRGRNREMNTFIDMYTFIYGLRDKTRVALRVRELESEL